ncbi:MAG: tetratricopeptide repeat protein [Gammaproteobacteria bacterium]|nr:tetratricopeptide repeat protein [Gammaproteobacteria bacterium]
MLFGKGAVLCALLLVLIIGCAGSEKKAASKTEQAAESKTAPAMVDVKIPPSARQQYDEGIAAMRSGNIAQAKNILSNLTKAYPDIAGPYVNLGIIHFRADEIDQAEEAFKQALKVNPESAVSLNHLGIIYRGKGKFDDARSSYEKALEIDPNYAYAHLNYGILLDLYLGELEKALNHYQKFQTLAPQQDKEVEKWIVDLERRMKKAGN